MTKKIYVDELAEFDRRVGLMARDDDFQGMPIQPTFASGLFSWRDLPILEAFVREHPSYHIVSIIRCGVSVNHLVGTARLFRLADGDRDASLICVWTDRYLHEWAEELGNRSSAKPR